MNGIAAIAAVLAALGGLAGASVGWGRLVRRFAGLPSCGHAVSAALGLAALSFIGGPLNLAGLAWPIVLDGLLVAGLALLAVRVAPAGEPATEAGSRPRGRRDRIQLALWIVLASATLLFTAATQLGPRQFNPGDDLQKYMAHAMRMTSTGTLAGSPFNALGTETLGAQALLQGFIVGHLPIRFINALDAVFCLGLCLALSGGIMRRRPAQGIAAVLGTLAVPLIDPLSVNVSSLYSSAALVMALVILGVDARERPSAGAHAARGAIAPGLLCAALVALKPTNAPFLALWLGLTTLATGLGARSWRPALVAAAWTLLWAGVFVAPWILLFSPYYVVGLLHPLPPPSIPIPAVREPIAMWSPEASFYGAAPLAYTIVAGALGVYAVFLFAMGRRADAVDRTGCLRLVAACAAAATFYVVANTVGVGLVEVDAALRYSVPTLIGVFPVALALGSLCADRPGTMPNRVPGTWLAAASALAALVIFAEPALRRARLAIDEGATLGYLQSWSTALRDSSRAYWEEIFNGTVAARLARYQRAVPEGEPLVAWVEAPIALDWARNPIIDVNESGLAPAWASMPYGRYVIWQYRGRYVRRPQTYLEGIAQFGRRPAFVWARTFEFHRRLTELVPRSRVLAHDDAEGFIVLRLPDAAER